MPSRPLAGVRVIDVTRLLPGAYATNAMRRIDVRPAPALGRDTDHALADAGLTAAAIARLRERGVI